MFRGIGGNAIGRAERVLNSVCRILVGSWISGKRVGGFGVGNWEWKGSVLLFGKVLEGYRCGQKYDDMAIWIGNNFMLSLRISGSF